MRTQKILLILADGFEEVEALGTVDFLRRLEFPVTLAGVGKTELTAAHGVRVTADRRLADCAGEDFAAVVLPGGMPGAANLRDSALVREVLQRAAAAGRVTAAICAAPIALAAAGLLEGRRFTIYPGCERYQPGMPTAPSTALAEVDGTVITGKGPGATFHFAAAIARALGAADGEIDALWNGMFLPAR